MAPKYRCPLTYALLGLVAFCCFANVLHANGALHQEASSTARFTRSMKANSEGIPPSVSPSPPPAPLPSSSVLLDDRQDHPFFAIRTRYGSRYFHASAKGFVRPAAVAKTSTSTHFERVPVRRGTEVQGWALKSSSGRLVAQRGSQLVLLAAGMQSGFLVFLPGAPLPQERPNATLLRTAPIGPWGSEGCLRYPRKQKPPGLNMAFESPCAIGRYPATDEDDAEADFFLESIPVAQQFRLPSTAAHRNASCSRGKLASHKSNTSAERDAWDVEIGGDDNGKGDHDEPSPPANSLPSPPPPQYNVSLAAMSTAGSATTLVPLPDVAHVALGVAVRSHFLTSPADLPLLKTFIPSLVASIRDAAGDEGEADPNTALETAAAAAAAATQSPPCSISDGTGEAPRQLPPTPPPKPPSSSPAPRMGVRFTLYLGYDAGDPTYDHPAALALVTAALRRALRALPVAVVAVRYGGEDKGAPCWVWNKLLARACATDSDSYFYQLNDDLELLTPGWAPRFVRALRSSDPPNFGITGPLDLNNERLMTQSFVHCTHLRALGFYYPW